MVEDRTVYMRRCRCRCRWIVVAERENEHTLYFSMQCVNDQRPGALAGADESVLQWKCACVKVNWPLA